MHTCLHIIPQDIRLPGGRWRRAWPEVLACLEAARADDGVRHVMVLVGGSQFGREARALGAEGFERVAPPGGATRRAAAALERLIDATDPGMIVSWDVSASGWVSTLRGAPGRLACVDLSLGQVVCRNQDPETGEVIRHWVTLAPQALPIPGELSRASLRAALDIDPGVIVVGVLGDWPERSHTLMYTLGMLGAAGMRCVGLGDPHDPMRGPLRRHVREHDHFGGLIESRAGSLTLWRACDVCLLASPDGAAPSFAWLAIAREILARGLPVIHAQDLTLEASASSPGRSRQARSGTPMDLARTAHAYLASQERIAPPEISPDTDPPPRLGRQLVAALRNTEALI